MQPSPATRRNSPSHGVDDVDEDTAQEVAKRLRNPGEGGGERPHPHRRFLVVELQQPHEREHVCNSEYPVLKRQPEEADRMHGIVKGLIPSLHFHRSCNRHGHGRQHEADAHALQLRDPRGVAREAAGEGHEEAVVDGDEEDHEEQGDDGDRRSGDLEGAEMRVHPISLLHREGLELRHAGIQDDGAADDGHHSCQDLHFFYLCARAHFPCRWLRVLREDCCFI